METNRIDLLAHVASLYYEDQLGQAEIAARTGYSRSMISRMLTEARETRLVDIRIRHPLVRRTDLEPQLQRLLGLQTARVLQAGAQRYEKLLSGLGGLAARLLQEQLRDDLIIGLSWGTAIWETVRWMLAGSHTKVQIVQMIGALGTQDQEIDGPELARRLALTLGGTYATLNAPLLVDSAQTRDALLEAPYITRVVEQFTQVGVALVGIGSVDPAHASLLRAGYLSLEQLAELRAAGAVGDVCALSVDRDGRLVETSLTRRVVGISAERLRHIPQRIGVAGGQHKVDAIIGAARAGLINVLVTDDRTATQIVQELAA